MKTLSQRKAQIEARLNDLECRLDHIAGELNAHETHDWEDRATEREDDEMLEDLGLSAQDEQRMLAAALDRIADGSYGDCVFCGEKISEERLDLLPGTPFCRAHARAADRR